MNMLSTFELKSWQSRGRFVAVTVEIKCQAHNSKVLVVERSCFPDPRGMSADSAGVFGGWFFNAYINAKWTYAVGRSDTRLDLLPTGMQQPFATVGGKGYIFSRRLMHHRKIFGESLYMHDLIHCTH